MKKILLSFLFLNSWVCGLHALKTTTLVGLSAEANILKLAEAKSISDLSFGTIYTNDSGGNVILSSDVKGGQGEINFSNASMRGLGDHQQGIVMISGGPDDKARFFIPAPSIYLFNQSNDNAEPMLAILNLQGQSGNDEIDLSISQGNADIVYVGGVLIVVSKQAVGVYRGGYDNVVTY